MTSNSKELIERLTVRLEYDSTGRDQFVSFCAWPALRSPPVDEGGR